MALASEGPEAAAEWAERAIAMARRVHRVKYEALARAVLGRALVALGREQDALRELRAAVRGADALGNPAGRWRAKADLAPALLTTGDDDGAEHAFREAAGIIHETAAGGAPEPGGTVRCAPALAHALV